MVTGKRVFFKLGGKPVPCQSAVIFVDLDAHAPPAAFRRGHERGASPLERIEHRVALEAEEEDAAPRQLNGNGAGWPVRFLL